MKAVRHGKEGFLLVGEKKKSKDVYLSIIHQCQTKYGQGGDCGTVMNGYCEKRSAAIWAGSWNQGCWTGVLRKGPCVPTSEGGFQPDSSRETANVSHEGNSRRLSVLERKQLKTHRGRNNGLNEGRQWAQRVGIAGRQSESAWRDPWVAWMQSKIQRQRHRFRSCVATGPRNFWQRLYIPDFHSTIHNYNDYVESCQFTYEHYFGNIPWALISTVSYYFLVACKDFLLCPTMLNGSIYKCPRFSFPRCLFV